MLLSRVAESLYWINRYLERAENISRFVEVSEAMALDCPPGSAEPWLPLIDASGDRNKFDNSYVNKTPTDVINFLIKDRENPNSILSCIFMARENSRQIRDVINKCCRIKTIRTSPIISEACPTTSTNQNFN